MVGGGDYRRQSFNRAVGTRIARPIELEAVLYLTAMEAGRTPDTLVVDEPVTIDGWSPRDFEPGFLGQITLQQAWRSRSTRWRAAAGRRGRPSRTSPRPPGGSGSPRRSSTDPAMALRHHPA